MQVPHPRPHVLSDPFDDFTPGMLRKILATPDSELKWYDYRHLLGPHLPAGTYEETVYFLPLAFDHAHAHADDALELCAPLIGYCSHHATALQADGLLESCRTLLTALLHHWTRRFRVIHFDEAGCRAKGWGLRHFDYVENAQLVWDALCELVAFRYHDDLPELFVHDLSLAADPVQAAWLLELAHQRRTASRVPDSLAIQAVLDDRQILMKAYALVRVEVMPDEPSPTYRTDVAKKLEL